MNVGWARSRGGREEGERECVARVAGHGFACFLFSLKSLFVVIVVMIVRRRWHCMI